MNYQPKGSMCTSCQSRDRDCSSMEFRTMQRLSTTDVNGEATTIVRCSEYQRGDARSEPIFEVGKPIPKIWLHMEFDFEDTFKYVDGEVVADQKELDRLVDKYLNGENWA